MTEIDVSNLNFLPLPLASGILLHICTNLIEPYSERGFLDTLPNTVSAIMTFLSITCEWLIISVWIFVSFWISYFEYFWIVLKFLKFFSTCFLVGFGRKTVFEPLFDKMYIVRVQLKSNNVL